MRNHFLIVVPVYNAEKYIEKCLLSILTQTYKNYTLVVVDDCSTDKTTEIINSIYRKHKNFKVHTNEKRIHSPLGNFVKGIQLCPGSPEDIIVTVDGDDRLYDNGVLAYLNIVYQNPEIWLTYGSFTSVSKRMEKYCYPIRIIQTYRRKGSWRTSHLRTLKRKLFVQIDDIDLRDTTTGEYYTHYSDAAYMYPAIEMAGFLHSKFIKKILYVYNDENPWCQLEDIYVADTHKEMRHEIKARTIYPRVESL